MSLKLTANSDRNFILSSNVSGTTRGELRFCDHVTTSGSFLIVNTSGNIGIGTTSPQALLDITGNFQINGNSILSTIGGNILNTPRMAVNISNKSVFKNSLFVTANYPLTSTQLPSGCQLALSAKKIINAYSGPTLKIGSTDYYWNGSNLQTITGTALAAGTYTVATLYNQADITTNGASKAFKNGNGPTLNTTDWSINFNGSQYIETDTNDVPIPSGGDIYTYVARWNGAPNGNIGIVYEQNTQSPAGSQRSAIIIWNNGYYGFNGESNDANQFIPYTANTERRTIMVLNNNKTTNVIGYDNEFVYTAGTSSPGGLSIGGYRAGLGRKISANAEYFIGKIFEVFVFSNALPEYDFISYDLHLSEDGAIKPSSSTWSTGSDERLKTNITLANLQTCYENVKSIPLKRYTWKDNIYSIEQVEDRSKLGWIAQDVEVFFPKAVSQTVNYGLTDCRDLNSDQLVATLYGCVQKLIIENEKLKNELDDRKSRINILKNKLTNAGL